MRKSLLIAVFLFVSCVCSFAQLDTAVVARMDAMLDDYVIALEAEPEATKFAECDFLISSCTDSLLRQRVALKLYGHYVDSHLMGEESVAIHIYDKWFADGKVSMLNEIDRMNAGIFADYNRNSLVGMAAPVLQMADTAMAPVSFPSVSDRQSVIYFYDVDCAKCKLETILLRYCLEEQEIPLDFYAVYVGSDEAAWRSYREEQLNICSTNVRTFHLWDPEAESGFHLMYGVLQTPRLFLVGATGTILGRRLSVDALDQLLKAGTVEYALMSRNPVGAKLPKVEVPGILRTRKRSVSKSMDLSRLKGGPAAVVFYSEGCNNCERELATIDGVLKGRAKVFLVNIDEILASDQDLARTLFDSFDLTVMPHAITVDSRGRITARYVSFAAPDTNR